MLVETHLVGALPRVTADMVAQLAQLNTGVVALSTPMWFFESVLVPYVSDKLT